MRGFHIWLLYLSLLPRRTERGPAYLGILLRHIMPLFL